MINRLSKFGSVLSTSIASEEVTNQYRDLESRLRSKKISAERLRQLITQAVKPADILLIEHELSDREAEIESMQGQLNVLSDQTSLSTITLTLVSKGNSAVVAPVKTREPSFRRAWRNSVNALGDIAQALAAAAGALLPFVPFLALLLAAALWLKRRATRRRNRSTNASTPATAATAPTPSTDSAIGSAPDDEAGPLH
jgi:VIT1/CCC1 family predicted Fe2+/Mn2+ transporter